MLLTCIFAALCLPLAFGFRGIASVTHWRYCQVRGFINEPCFVSHQPHYERDIETAYRAYQAVVSAQNYKSRRRVRVGKFRFITI